MGIYGLTENLATIGHHAFVYVSYGFTCMLHPALTPLVNRCLPFSCAHNYQHRKEFFEHSLNT